VRNAGSTAASSTSTTGLLRPLPDESGHERQRIGREGCNW
jgi:hypothetical protein